MVLEKAGFPVFSNSLREIHKEHIHAKQRNHGKPREPTETKPRFLRAHDGAVIDPADQDSSRVHADDEDSGNQPHCVLWQESHLRDVEWHGQNIEQEHTEQPGQRRSSKGSPNRAEFECCSESVL